VSVLKPVLGVDLRDPTKIREFLPQDYPDDEVLFAVNDDKDAAVPMVRQSSRNFPSGKFRLLVGAENFGTKPQGKQAGRLAREAQNEVLV